jgi:hypothetical protein
VALIVDGGVGAAETGEGEPKPSIPRLASKIRVLLMTFT